MSQESPDPVAAPSATGTDWPSALAEFVSSRLELIRLESKDAGRVAAEKFRFTVILIVTSVLGWLCLLAGLIGLLHHLTQWSWWCCALVFGAFHVVLACYYAVLLKRPAPPAFPLTSEEFQKDRLWIQSLKTPNSKL